MTCPDDFGRPGNSAPSLAQRLRENLGHPYGLIENSLIEQVAARLDELEHNAAGIELRFIEQAGARIAELEKQLSTVAQDTVERCAAIARSNLAMQTEREILALAPHAGKQDTAAPVAAATGTEAEQRLPRFGAHLDESDDVPYSVPGEQPDRMERLATAAKLVGERIAEERGHPARAQGTPKLPEFQPPRTAAWQDADWRECGNTNDYKRMLLAYGHCAELERDLARLQAENDKLRSVVDAAQTCAKVDSGYNFKALVAAVRAYQQGLK